MGTCDNRTYVVIKFKVWADHNTQVFDGDMTDRVRNFQKNTERQRPAVAKTPGLPKQHHWFFDHHYPKASRRIAYPGIKFANNTLN